jgi:hypothetical protein
MVVGDGDPHFVFWMIHEKASRFGRCALRAIRMLENADDFICRVEAVTSGDDILRSMRQLSNISYIEQGVACGYCCSSQRTTSSILRSLDYLSIGALT